MARCKFAIMIGNQRHYPYLYVCSLEKGKICGYKVEFDEPKSCAEFQPKGDDEP
jgi:hypothetical protein